MCVYSQFIRDLSIPSCLIFKLKSDIFHINITTGSPLTFFTHPASSRQVFRLLVSFNITHAPIEKIICLAVLCINNNFT